ncbi:MAG TPA: hypothetical protein VKE70_30755 [Candidatus Solibacter sp.]|nr:hypothetical protein [Candidatus Solibacter sp.]
MSGSRPERTPVVALGAAHHGGVAIARSLGRLGVPVYSVDSEWSETAFSSRYCRGRWLLDWTNDRTGGSLDRLLAIGRTVGDRPLLVPFTDQGAIWVAEHAAVLEQAFRFPRLDANLVRTLCDKSRMQKLAERYGLPVAQSIVPHCLESLELFASDISYPLMVKATDANRMRAYTGGTKFIVQNRADLCALFEKAWDGHSPNFLAQEFVPGEDWMFDGYFDDASECLFGITAKKIRRFPARTGVTSLGVCLKNEALHTIITEFMKAIGYRGILDIGFRHDLRTGDYKIMDVNPRIGSSFRLFAAADGTDVARVSYLHQTGCPIPCSAAVEGRKWITEDFDLLSSARSLWDGTLSPRAWLASFKGVQELACFAVDDPLPAVMMAIADCRELWKWIRHRGGDRRPPERVQWPALLANTRRR